MEGRCLAHLDEAELEQALAACKAEGRISAGGVRLDTVLVQRILEAFNSSLPDAEFPRATFTEAVSFSRVRFEGRARFDHTTFEGPATFWGATFMHSPIFDGATFMLGVEFSPRVKPKIAEDVRIATTFERRAHFIDAKFEGPVNFKNVTFGLVAWFDGAVFAESASFEGVTFGERPSFDRATLSGDTSFAGAKFRGGLSLVDIALSGSLSFSSATFEAPAEFDGATFSGEVSFGAATFESRASFAGARFEQHSMFSRAVFRGAASFGGTRFGGDASFEKATFEDAAYFFEPPGDTIIRGFVAFTPEDVPTRFSGQASFSGAIFQGDAWFSLVRFVGWARFDRSRFERGAWFNPASFRDGATFAEATFAGPMSLYQSRFGGTRIADFNRAVFRSEAWIGDVTFAEDAFFSEATFGADAPFYEVTFERSGYFDRASFERAQNIGLLQGGSVSFAGATFNRSVHLAVSTDRLDCVGTQFRGGANLDVGRAEVVLDGAEFDRTSVLVALPSQGGGVDPLRRPRLLSLRGADVGELRLVDVDLRACRFFRAQNLDGLRLEGDCEFASTPVGWTFRRPLPLRRRWIARQTIAEEHEWRYRRQRRTQLEPSPDEGAEPGDDWYPPACRPAPWLSEVAPQLKALEPGELASIYRSLRKGREDNKDEPGAADFYYGEMEMRRRPPGSGKSIFERRSASKAERVLIWLYWLVSGYGLRASRALAALVVTVLVFAFLLHEWGFEGPESFGEALLFSTESTTSIFRGRERELTGSGEVLALALRLLGPVFFGLMVLSLRGRVRR